MLEELGSGAQQQYTNCAIGSEYKKYMNMKYPKKKDKMKAPDHGAPSESLLLLQNQLQRANFLP